MEEENEKEKEGEKKKRKEKWSALVWCLSGCEEGEERRRKGRERYVSRARFGMPDVREVCQKCVIRVRRVQMLSEWKCVVALRALARKSGGEGDKKKKERERERKGGGMGRGDTTLRQRV